MSFEVKQSVAVRVPVTVRDSTTGARVAGVLFSAVTVTVRKSDGTYAQPTVTSPDWSEATTGDYLNQGVYHLLLPSSVLNLTGPFQYAVKTGAGNEVYHGSIKVVANEEVDTFGRVGAPVGASISADIANVYSRQGAPAGASQSADVAAVYSRIGAPVGASISADVAAVPNASRDATLNAARASYLVAGSVGEGIALTLGLSKQNMRLFSPTYNSKGLLTAWTMRVYPTQADADADTNPIATYTGAATAQAPPNDHLVATWKLTKNP